MIEFLSNSISSLRRDDRAWYVCSILIVASILAIGFNDLYIRAPQIEIKKSQIVSRRSISSVAEEDIGTKHDPVYVAHWDFFGTPEQSAPEVDIETLPETALDLKLIGTFTSDTEFSSAVIRTGKGESKRVFLRQKILDGVTLHTINEKQIVVARGSILETLKLYEFTKNEYAANPNRPSYLQEEIQPLAITTPRSLEGGEYQNTVSQQRKVRKERRAQYIASMNSTEASAATRAHK